MGERIGYIRISTAQQNLDMQREAMEQVGCSRIFQDTASGMKTERPQLVAALDYVRPGDTLVVWRLDRLGRSLRHLIDTVGVLNESGVGFQSVHEAIDTTTSTGKLIFHIFAALAEFERELIVDRTKSGLDAARARGSKPGRRPSLSPDQVVLVQQMFSQGDHTVTQIAHVVGGVSRATIYRALQAPSP